LIRDWLQLFRAHTAPATILLIIIPFLVGGGKLFSLNGLLVLLFAWASHLVSFGHNTVMDTQGGWDVRDPNKSHHPLVRGVIPLEKAHNVIHTLMFVLVVYGIVLPYLCGGNISYALIFLLFWVTAGHGYNDGLGKTLLPSFIPIAISITSASLYGYFLAAKEFSDLMFLIALYVFLTIWFQTSIEGNLKEIEAKEANLLVWMGAKCDGRNFEPGYAGVYGLIIKNLSILMALLILIFVGENLWLVATYILFGGAMIVLAVLLTEEREWNRKRTLLYCALEEVFSIYLLCVILLPKIGYLEGLMLMAGGLIYFWLFNRMEWGTRLTPMV